MSQLDDDPRIKDFVTWVDKACVAGVTDPTSKIRPKFLPFRLLKDYFEVNQYYNLKGLLRAVFQSEELSVEVDKVADKYPVVFCTLLFIGRARHIRSFIQHDHLQDVHLPFDRYYPPRDFPDHTSDQDPREFLTQFCKQQWMLCIPDIYYRISRRFDPDQILPILYLEKLAGGGSAVLYKIVLHQDYNRLHTSDDISPARANPFANTFILKTYFGRDAERYHTNEVSAFKKIGTKTSSMIGYFASFVQGERYNILLEYADKGSLEQYFKAVHPPTRGEDIISFWESLFMLIEALLRIHEGATSLSSDGSMQPLQGWHQDVKPSNILVSSKGETIISPYEWRFKLADLGISHFKTQASALEDGVDHDSQGTGTYGPPEWCRTDKVLMKSRIYVKQNVDVWSLGAILSEAAVWLVEGHQGVKQYRKDRRTEIKNIPGFENSDCFHDGENMQAAVRRQHKRLEDGFRKHDVITGQVLSLAEDMMLDERSRLKTITCWRKSRRILDEAKKKLNEMRLETGVSILTKRESSVTSLEEPAREYDNIADQGLGAFQPSLVDYYEHRPLARSDSAVGNEFANLSFYPQTGPQLQTFDSRRGVYATQSAPVKNNGLQIHPEYSEDDEGDAGYLSTNKWHTPGPARAVSMPPGLIGQPEESFQKTPQRGLSTQAGRSLQYAPGIFTHGASADPYFFQQRYQPSEYLPPPIPTTPEPSIKHEPPAILQVGIASIWRTKRGKINELPGDFLFDRLKARDHVFIVDDALSMSKYWKELLRLFEVLAYMVKSADPDGIDLYFTMSDEKFNSKDRWRRNSSRKLVGIVENRRLQGSSNITYRLDSILAPYEAKLTNSHNLRRGSTLRPLNIYILTDGVWEPGCDGSSAIRKIDSKLMELKYPKDSKQIGIQFIRFGSDPDGAKKLEYLDDNLEQEMDIVDTTPSNGNVWKMLLGAIDKTFDEVYETLPTAATSSEPLQYPEFKDQEIPRKHPIKTVGTSSDITSFSRQSIFSAAGNTGISSDLESGELARDSSLVGERDQVVGVKKLSLPVSDLNKSSEHAYSKSEAPEDAHDDLKSVVSYNDDIASQVSGRIMIHEVTAEKILASMLAKHVELKPLFEIALTRTNTSRFENNFRKVLKGYYLDLVQFANTNLERATVQIIRSRGARIRVSRDITQQIRPDYDEDSNSLISKDFENRKQDLENWIASNSCFARPAEPDITNDEVDRDGEVDVDDAGSDSESDSGEHPYLPSLAEMEKFMLGGYSFRSLTTKIRSFLLPDASLPLYRVLFTIPSDKITFSSENNDSFLNNLKNFVEDHTEDDWNWWPLQPRMRPLAKDQTRVTWECHCGTLQWAEIPSSQVDTYRLILGANVTLQDDHLCTHRQRVPWRITLLKSMQKLAGPASISTQPPMATGSTSQPISLQNIQPTASSSTSIHQGPSPPFYPTQTVIPNQQGVPINLPGSNLDLYVLFGVKGSRRTIELAQLEVRNNYNDSAFFKDLKDEYRRRRGFWRYWLSIWQLRYCDFVKFKKIMANRIISHSTGLPEDNIYEYKPRPPNAEMPPIHPHEFELAFSACSSDGFCSLFHDCIKLPTGRCFAVERIPKLKGRFEINTDDFQDAWGIQARYAISFLNMVLYHLFIIATTFGFWAWWMLVHPNDLQNAAVPLTIVLALISLFWSSAGVLKIFREPE